MQPGMIVHYGFAYVGPYLGPTVSGEGERFLWDQGDMLVIPEQVLRPLHISWCANTPNRAWEKEVYMGSVEHGGPF